MEIKLKDTEIKELCTGLEYILKDVYCDHIPELYKLSKGDSFPFYKVILADESIMYVGYFNRTKPNVNPKLIKHYARNKKRDYPSSITIKCNRMIELPGQMFICI